MQITCPRCTRVVPTDALNMQQLVGKCTHCNELFSFQDQLPRRTEGHSHDMAPIAVPQPDNVAMKQEGLGLTFQWRWFRYYVFFLIPFALFWNAIVFSFVGAFGAFPWISGVDGDFEWLSLLTCIPAFILPHTWVGLGLIYYILTLLLNRTVVTVDRAAITVRHRPLPWLGNKTIPVGQIEQLYVKSNFSRFQRGEPTYGVHLVDQANKHAKLVTGLSSSDHALYLEQEIERYLGIVDRPVRGEFR